jgi:hypothetical protein
LLFVRYFDRPDRKPKGNEPTELRRQNTARQAKATLGANALSRAGFTDEACRQQIGTANPRGKRSSKHEPAEPATADL